VARNVHPNIGKFRNAKEVMEYPANRKAFISEGDLTPAFLHKLRPLYIESKSSNNVKSTGLVITSIISTPFSLKNGSSSDSAGTGTTALTSYELSSHRCEQPEKSYAERGDPFQHSSA
jgi:hypothetical protein